MRIKERYEINKNAKKGDTCICPSCGTEFIKDHPQQAFCRTKKGTRCKDSYWNTVTPHKRNNTTRISRANREFYENHISRSDDDHPFSSEGLGQWL